LVRSEEDGERGGRLIGLAYRALNQKKKKDKA
jgi:hypothetical protein